MTGMKTNGQYGVEKSMIFERSDLTAHSDVSGRLPYIAPVLSVFGSIRALTATNAGSCMDDGNNGCGTTANGMAFMV